MFYNFTFFLLPSIKMYPLKNNVLADFKMAVKYGQYLGIFLLVFIRYVSRCKNIISFLPQTVKECTNLSNLVFLG